MRITAPTLTGVELPLVYALRCVLPSDAPSAPYGAAEAVLFNAP